MAYLVSLERLCQNGTCKKLATEQLYGRKNDAHGVYCGPHGRNQRLALDKEEQR